MSDDNPEPTGSKQAATQFKPGQSGNPAGRPKGARGKLAEAFVADLYADWQDHGRDAIAKVRTDRPHEYLKVTASILPKQLEVKTDAFDGISDEELAALVTIVRAAIDPAEASGSGTDEAPQPKPTGGLQTLQ